MYNVFLDMLSKTANQLLQESSSFLINTAGDPRGYDYEQQKKNVAGSEPIGPIASIVLFTLGGCLISTCCVMCCIVLIRMPEKDDRDYIADEEQFNTGRAQYQSELVDSSYVNSSIVQKPAQPGNNFGSFVRPPQMFQPKNNNYQTVQNMNTNQQDERIQRLLQSGRFNQPQAQQQQQAWANYNTSPQQNTQVFGQPPQNNAQFPNNRIHGGMEPPSFQSFGQQPHANANSNDPPIHGGIETQRSMNLGGYKVSAAELAAQQAQFEQFKRQQQNNQNKD